MPTDQAVKWLPQESIRRKRDGPVLDKHSTGGVGDPDSLALGPMLAA